MDKLNVLDYDELVSKYDESLLNNLRNFKPVELDYLDTWVSDEDPNRSIINLLDAAELGGVEQLTLKIGQDTFAKINKDQLAKDASQVGEVHFLEDADGHYLCVTMKAAAAATKIPAYYRNAVLNQSQNVRANKRLVQRDGLELVHAEEDGTTLWLLVNPEKHEIVEAAFEASSAEAAVLGVMEQLCRILPGLTIQDACDHGALKTEFVLRDGSMERPVQGLVTPEHTPELFGAPTKLLRGIAQDYKTKHGIAGTVNFYTPPVSEEWNKLTQQAKQDAVMDVVREVSPALGIDADMLEMIYIDDDVKVTLSFAKDGLKSHEKAKVLMDLEKRLKASVNPNLLLYQAERRDMNVKRRL